MTNFIPIAIGEVFGRLTVIKQGERTKAGHVTWLCRCECGAMTSPAGSSLRRGVTTSCGCLHREITKVRVSNSVGRLGMQSTPLSDIEEFMS